MRVRVPPTSRPTGKWAVPRAGIITAQCRGTVILMHVVCGPARRDAGQDRIERGFDGRERVLHFDPPRHGIRPAALRVR